MPIKNSTSLDDALLPSHALIVTSVDTCQGNAKLPKRVAPFNEGALGHVPAEACIRGVMVECHPKATREADGKFGGQSTTR